MSNSAYLLVKFENKEKLIQAFDQLQDISLFENYDAVDGHYHLMIKTVNQDDKTLDLVRSFDGFADMSVCPIEVDNQKEFVLDESFTYCYLFIEVNAAHLADVQNKLTSFPDTLFCSKTRGEYDLIALIKNEKFDKIDRFIKTEIKNLDGILRFKQDHVIFLDRI